MSTQHNKQQSRFVMDPAVLRGASLLTIPQFTVANPAFTESSVRWIIFNRGDILEKEGAIVRSGRRILIVPDKFIACAVARVA